MCRQWCNFIKPQLVAFSLTCLVHCLLYVPSSLTLKISHSRTPRVLMCLYTYQIKVWLYSYANLNVWFLKTKTRYVRYAVNAESWNKFQVNLGLLCRTMVQALSCRPLKKEVQVCRFSPSISFNIPERQNQTPKHCVPIWTEHRRTVQSQKVQSFNSGTMGDVHEIKILGVCWTVIITDTSNSTLGLILHLIKCLTHERYLRDLCLLQRTGFVHTYRSFATRVSQLKIWHFWVIGIERNVCRCTFNRYSVITQLAKLAAGEQFCCRCIHRKL